MKNIRRIINITFIILGMFFIAYYICVRIAGYRLSILIIWLVLGAVFCAKGMWSIRFGKTWNGWRRAADNCLNASALLFILSFTVFSAGILSSIGTTPNKNLDYIIILGAAIKGENPSPTLKARIDAAYDYLLENENTKAIASGGQGSNEDISEGECIATVLIGMGISENRILIENKSTTTVENLKYSLMLIDTHDKTFGVVTSNFHVFRSRTMLRHYIQKNADGISAKFSGIAFLHYMLREYIAFHADLLMGNIY